MVLITGPVSVYIYKVQGKSLFLFGDIHTNQLKTYKNAIPIMKFIDSLPQTTDLFLESPYLSIKAKNQFLSFAHFSVITTMYNYYKDKLYKHNNRDSNLRVHYTDIRLGSDIDIFMSIVDNILEYLVNNETISIKDFDVLIQYFSTTQKMYQYMNCIVHSNNFIVDVLKIFPKFSHHDIVTKAPNEPFQVHRVRKQLLKLDTNLQAKLLNYHAAKCREIINSTKVFNKTMKRMRDTHQIYKNDTIDILMALISWTTHIKDMYTLSRMLYYVSQGAQHIVSYDGNQHTLNYVEFFNHYAQDIAIPMYHQSIIESPNKRNITIPNTTMKQVSK